MAVTHGHGNPNWNRDETILALEFYFATRGRNAGPKDPQIIALSGLLRSLPYHVEAARKPTFRNPDGAAFKVQNLRSLETGRGLGNVSRMDRDIWAEFGSSPAEVARLASLIKAEVIAEQETRAPEPDDEGGLEFYEGRLLTQKHMRRERSPALRRNLLKRRKQLGELRCDLCDEAHLYLPPELRDAAFEAHHVVPIATAGEGPTNLRDVALLCATCHRVVHRAIAIKREWLSLAEAKRLIAQTDGEAAIGARARPDLS